MSSYRYTEYGAGYPSTAGYHDNTGYYGSGKDVSRKGSQRLEVPPSFEPVRTYPSQVMMSRSPKFNWHMLRTAVAAMLFCPLCGIISLVYALISYVDFNKGNMGSYSSRKNCSLGWSITGIVLFVIWFLCGLIIPLVYVYA